MYPNTTVSPPPVLIMNSLDVFPKNNDFCLDTKITGKSAHVDVSGGLADVYSGFLGSQKVAIKVVRPFAQNGFRLTQTKLLGRVWREHQAWSRLSHPNILACLGYSYDFSPPSYTFPALISPWMDNGTLDLYSEKYPDVDRIKMLIGVANGLSYLHNHAPVIVHGDIRAGNILVSEQGTPCLTDFGLSRVLEGVKGMTTSSNPGGTLRWMSPELLEPDGNISVKSDVWAYGMTIIEVLTGERPYSTINYDVIVLGCIKEGKVPERPQNLSVLDDPIWSSCLRCWSRDPTDRPSIQEVISMISASEISELQVSSSTDVAEMLTAPTFSTEEMTAAMTRTLAGGTFCATDLISLRVSVSSSSIAPVYNKNPDANTGHILISPEYILNNTEEVRCFGFSADGKSLAVGTRQTVEVYDTKTGTKKCNFHSDCPRHLSCVCLNPDGTLLATSSGSGEIMTWKPTSKKAMKLNASDSRICALEFSNDGRLLVSAGGKLTKSRKVRLYNTESYRETLVPIPVDFDFSNLKKWSKIVAFSPDGRLLAIGRHTHVWLWDVHMSAVVERLIGRRYKVCCVAFTPDGKGLVSGTVDGKINIWDLKPFFAHLKRHEPLGLNVASSVIEGKGERGSVCIRDNEALNDRGEDLLCIAVAQDNRTVISSSTTGCVRFWNSVTSESTQLQYITPGPVAISVDLSPTTGMLATIGDNMNSTILWNYTLKEAKN